MVNDDPLDALYGRPATHAERRVLSRHNARDDLHCLGDPEWWGWRRPQLDELLDEKIAALERMFDEPG
jgi:hypothetical protein